MTQRYVALMRGINVGGKNRIAMADLRACFEEAGCTSVATYIQSGNVVFDGEHDAAKSVAESVPRILDERFGLSVPVIVRRAREFADAVEANPFLAEGVDPAHLSIGFLASEPDSGAVASLDPARSSVDHFSVLGREVYLYVPGGMARTRLTTAFFDRGLGTTMTTRNWRTVNKLVEMLGQA